MKNHPLSALFLALVLVFTVTSCGRYATTATGYWQSPSTSSGGYIWLQLKDGGSSVTGSMGTNTTTGSIAINGSWSGGTLSVGYSSSSSRIDFTGPIDGDTFTAYTTICSTSCTAGTIKFRRTSTSSSALVNTERTKPDVQALQDILNDLR
jgi:hypothetical protein